MGEKRPPGSPPPNQVNLRLSSEIRERIGKLVNKYPFATATSIAQLAIERRLPLVEAEFLPPQRTTENKAHKAA